MLTQSTDLAGHCQPHWRVGAPDVVEVDLDDPHVVVSLAERDAGVLVAGAVEEAGGEEPVSSLLVERGEEGEEVGEVEGGGEGGHLAPLTSQTLLDKPSL